MDEKEGVICYRYGFLHFEMPPPLSTPASFPSLSIPFFFLSLSFPSFRSFHPFPLPVLKFFMGFLQILGVLSTNRCNHQPADLRLV